MNVLQLIMFGKNTKLSHEKYSKLGQFQQKHSRLFSSLQKDKVSAMPHPKVFNILTLTSERKVFLLHSVMF